MTTEIRVPTLGESVTEATIGSWFKKAGDSVSADETLLDIDRRCHEITWAAASNRFLTDNLDMLYAHSDRVWHMYLAEVADTRHAVDEHIEILDLLRARDADASAAAVEAHVRSFDDQVRAAVTTRLGRPLVG